MSVILLIGHRGVGKSTLLRRLGTFRRCDRHYFDLDQEMEIGTGTRIDQLLKNGEPAFRRLEVETLQSLVDEAKQRYSRNAEQTFVAVGAGIEKIPDGTHVVWIRRSTDALGRVFENRPRLDSSVSAFDEYMERFKIREPRFQAWAHEQLWLPEGFESGLEGFFEHRPDWNLPYDLTLLSENFREWPMFVSTRQRWGIRRFEIRDDLLDPAQIAQALKDIPPERVLFSLRKGSIEHPEGVQTDWALELGAPTFSPTIVSLHERDSTVKGSLRKFETAPPDSVFKLAIEIRSFEELMEGHRWWLEAPQKRAFLPRSNDGRWRWYRSLFGPAMPVHFIREGEGSGLDQPFLWQAVLQPPFQREFAAVLGDPIEHSRSPMEHQSFFKEFHMPFVSVRMTEDEWASGIKTLRRLGLGFAAVTAPLKLRAGGNTLTWIGDKFKSDNTDALALAELADDLEVTGEIWCWGRGGVSASVARAWPKARLISAREGVNEAAQPGLFIWATGRGREFKWPSDSIRPRKVLDLNYSDDSPGLEWAVKHNFPYQSGLRMFKLQAEFQRQIWRSHLETR